MFIQYIWNRILKPSKRAVIKNTKKLKICSIINSYWLNHCESRLLNVIYSQIVVFSDEKQIIQFTIHCIHYYLQYLYYTEVIRLCFIKIVLHFMLFYELICDIFFLIFKNTISLQHYFALLYIIFVQWKSRFNPPMQKNNLIQM